MFASYLKTRNLYIFLVWAVILIYLAYIHQQAFTIPQIMNMPVVDAKVKEGMLNGFKTWRWIAFAAVPVLIFLRVSLVGCCLFVGATLDEKFQKLDEYRTAYGIAMKADVVSVLHALISSVVIIAFFRDNADRGEALFSMVWFIDTDAVEKWLVVPFAALNIFEFIYWFFLSKLVAVVSGNKYWQSFGFVLRSYGLGYLLYIILMMFLLLYLT